MINYCPACGCRGISKLEGTTIKYRCLACEKMFHINCTTDEREPSPLNNPLFIAAYGKTEEANEDSKIKGEE